MPQGTIGTTRPKNRGKIIRGASLEPVPGLVHGFSTRLNGHSQIYGKNQLNLGFTASDVRETVERNRSVFVSNLGAEDLQLFTLRQIHSDVIHVMTEPAHFTNGKAPAADGMITNVPGVLLGIQTADCLPVLLADPRQHLVAAVHAGWRGTVKRITAKAVGIMRARFGSRPGDIRAAIGPGIHACCYAVGSEVIEAFTSQFAYARELFTEVFDKDPVKKKYPLLFLTARAPGHSDIGPEIHLDLVEANRRQLLEAGVKKGNIWCSEECTSCRTDLLFSHRAEHGYTGRMMAAIGFRQPPEQR